MNPRCIYWSDYDIVFVCVFVIRCLQKDYYLCCINTHSSVFFESGTLKNTHREIAREENESHQVNHVYQFVDSHVLICTHFTILPTRSVSSLTFNSIPLFFVFIHNIIITHQILPYCILPYVLLLSLSCLCASLSISLFALLALAAHCTANSQPDSSAKIRRTASSDLHGYKRYIDTYVSD